MPIHSSDITSRNKERSNAFVERSPFLCVLSFPLPHCKYTTTPQPSPRDISDWKLMHRHPRGALEIDESLVESLRRSPGNGWDFLEIHSTVNAFIFHRLFSFLISSSFLKDSQPEIQKKKDSTSIQRRKANSNTRGTTEKKSKTFWDFGFAFHEMVVLLKIIHSGCNVQCVAVSKLLLKNIIWKLQNQKKP